MKISWLVPLQAKFDLYQHQALETILQVGDSAAPKNDFIQYKQNAKILGVQLISEQQKKKENQL